MWHLYTPLSLLALMMCLPADDFLFSHADSSWLPADATFYLEGRTEARFELPQPTDEMTVRLCDLHPGHQYRLWVTGPRAAAFAGRLFLQKQSAPTGMLPGNRPSGKWWGRYHRFVAEGKCLELAVRGYAEKLKGRPLVVSIQCTDCAGGRHREKGGDQPELPVLSVFNQSAAYLIENVLVSGGCFSISGVTPIGPSGGRGEFFNGLSSVGFDHGVILESGSIFNAPGPNNSDEAGNDLFAPGDPDLDDLNVAMGGFPNDVYDAVGIEFDFTPTIDTITFNYVFASEEYCEYVGSQFNDVFGFFISGPGINGGFTFNGENIALVPGTGQYVAINTVNHLQNQIWFNPNQSNCGSTTNMTDIQFDGYTAILTATAVVIPCETYHIRLVVGDVGDGIYDSAVFLEANSFTPGNAVEANVVTLAGPSGTNATIYEGCTGNFIVFERQNPDNSQPLDVTYTISPSSTATPGTDYDPLPTTVTIPAGQDTIMVPFTAFADGIPEGIETVIIELDNPCTCSTNTVTIQIEDVDLQVSMPDVTGCGASPVTLTPTVSGAPEPYSYNWSTGATTPSITVAPTPGVPTTYTVTVTDACGDTQTATATVTLDLPPTAILSGNGAVCGTGTTSVDVTVNFTGNGPWVFVYTVDGVAQAPVTTSSNPYTFTVNGVSAGTVIGLLSVDYANNSCPGAVNGTVTITQVDLQVTATPTDVQCAGAGDGQITVSVTGGSGNYTYQWSGGLPPVPNPTGVPPGTYTVTVTDVDQNCDGTATVTVNEPSPLNVSVSATPANCNGGGSATVSVSGGTPAYTYTWTGGISGANPTGIPAGTYDLTVTDANGCTQTASVTIAEDLTPPTAVASANGTITCANPELTLSGAGSSSGSNFTYQWSGPGIVSGANTLNPTINAGGTYTLTVTNTENGCTATASVTVPENTTPPIATGSGGTVTCYNPLITISGVGSSTGSQYTYQWSGPGIVSGANTLTPTVNAGGTYTLTVTDTNNGCTATADVTVFENTTPPQVNLNAPDITCANPEVTISGAGSSVGANFTYEWSGPGIVSGANGLFPTVNQPGTYALTVTNTANGCTTTASVTVGENTTPPQAVILPPAPLDCLNPTLTLSGSGSSAGHHSYQWSGPGIVAGANTLSPTVDAAGTYTLVVTDNVNGCTDTASVTVVDNSNPPTAVAGVSNNLDCTHATATLFSSGSTTGPGIQYTWTGPGIVSGQFSPTAVVDQAGTYVLSVYDSNNGCTSSAAVVVQATYDYPEVDAGPDQMLTCTTSEVMLDGTGSAPGPHVAIQWTALAGNILSGAQTLTPLVNEPGTYVLTLADTLTGCSAADTAVVSVDAAVPVADAGPDRTLTCATGPSITLDASASSSGPEYSYSWSTTDGYILSGDSTLSPLVGGPGTYQLVVTNLINGCTAYSSVQVSEDYTAPTPSIAVSGLISCQQSTVWLDASASANADAFAWSTPDGLILSDPALPQIEVGTGGTYVLTLTNGATGCSSADTVQVAEDFTMPLPQIAPPLPLTCAADARMLDATASVVDSLTNIAWSTLDGHIASGDSTLQPVVDAPGQYTLVLTHELSGCIGTAVVTVTRDTTPPAVDAGPPLTLDCTLPQGLLQGQVEAGTLVWWTTPDGHIASGDSTLTPTVDAPGAYLLHALNPANGCTATDTVEVIHAGELPQIAIAAPPPLTCALPQIALDASASEFDSTFTLDWQTTDGHFVGGTDGLTPLVDAPGTYTLSITNTANGCTSTQSVVVVADTAAPVPLIEPPALMGCNLPAQQLQASVAGSGPDLIFQWSTPDGLILSGADSLQPVVGSGGTYVLEVLDPANGCSARDTVVVIQDLTAPQVALGPDLVFNCATDSLVVQAQVSGHPDHLQYTWQTADGLLLGQQGPVAHLGTAGTYVLQVIDTVNFCESTDTLVVQADDTPPEVTIAAPQALTCALAQVVLDGSASAAGPEYAYSWSTPDGLLLGDTTLPVVTAAAPGTYQLTVFNADNQCFATATVTVEADTLAPEASVLPPQVLTCNLPQQTLSGVVNTPWPYTVQWQAANGGHIVADAQSLTPLVDSPGTYTMTVTHTGNGCSTTVSVEVAGDFQVPQPQIAPPDMLTCLVTSTTLDASASFGDSLAFAWTTNDGLLLGGTQAPVATAGAPGTYWLTLTDLSNGCSQTTSVVVQQDVTPPMAQAQASGAITCAQSAVSLTSAGSSAGPQFAYLWTTPDGLILSGNQAPTATVGAPGTYQLQVTNNENGCSTTTEVAVAVDTVAPPLSIAASGSLTCAQPQLSLSANTTLAPGSWTVQWTTPDGHIVAGAQQPVVIVDAGGTYVAQLTNLANGCSSTASAVVQADTLAPQVSLSANGALTCTQDAVLLTAALDVPPPATAVEWTGPDGQPLPVSGLTFEADQPGTYQIAVTNLGNGCQGTATATVEDARVWPEITIAPPEPLTCLTDQVALEVQVEPAAGLTSLQWTTTDGHIAAGDQSLTPLVDAPGTYQLTATHAASGCTATASVQVLEDRDAPLVDAGPDKVLDCHHTEVVLEGQAAGADLQILWLSEHGQIAAGQTTLTPVVDAPGTYVLQVTDAGNGCTATDEVEVIRVVPEELLVEVLDPLCHGMTGAISVLEVEGGMPPYSYSLDGEDFTLNPLFTGVPPGEYAVLALDANGCVVADTVEVIEPEAIELWVAPVDVLHFGDSLLLEAHTNLRPHQIASVQWTPVEGLSCDTCLVTWAQPYESNWYSVLLVDLNGCSAEETVFLRVDKRPAIYVPNAFSPNGDGNNDRFYIFAKPGVVREIREFLIFDRWGEAVYRYEHFQPNDPASGWDGTHRGRPMNPQVLVWHAVVELVDGRVVTLKGDVTLVR